VLDQQHGNAVLAAQLVDQALQVLFLLRVQAGGGFVKHEHARLGDHAARDLQAALVAVGQVAGLAVDELAQAHHVQPVQGALDLFLFAAAVARRVEQARQQVDARAAVLCHQQVFQHRHGLEQAHVLEGAHHAVVGHVVAAAPLDGAAVQRDGAAAGLVETADAVEHRGLAGAVGADDGKHFLRTHVEARVVHGQQAAEAHAQVFDF